MANQFKKGDRVTWSDEARKLRAGRRNPARRGTVISEPKYPDYVVVVWDGLSRETRYTYRTIFINKVSDGN